MKIKISDKILKWIIFLCAISISILFTMLIIFIILESKKSIFTQGLNLINPNAGWFPTSLNPSFGLLPTILGTLYVSFLGVIISIVFGVGCAYFINYYIPKYLGEVFLSFIDIVSGIPSVIFGFIGLSIVVKYFTIHFKMAAGQCILAASIVLSTMLLPFVISNVSESITSARKNLEPSALSLGITKEFCAFKIIFPKIIPSVISGAIMAFGRAIGETMAVMMVIGNAPIFPKLLGRGQTIASLTALEMGSIEIGSIHLSVLYTANFILLLILIVTIFIGEFIKRRFLKNE